MKKSELDELREKVFDVEEERRKLSIEIKRQDKKIEELTKKNEKLKDELKNLDKDYTEAEAGRQSYVIKYNELFELTADHIGATPNRSSLDTSTLPNLLKYEALAAQWDDIKLEDIEAIIKK